MKLFIMLLVILAGSTSFGQCPNCARNAAISNTSFQTVTSVRTGYSSVGSSVRTYGSTGGYAMNYGSNGSSVRTYGSAVVYTNVPIQRYASTSNSSLAQHMANDHGVDITGKSEAQLNAEHNAIHSNNIIRSRFRFRLFR